MTATYDQPKDVLTRVRFFDGQYLQDQDFVDEQHYHVDRTRRHARFLHVAGIADGLAVTAVPGQAQVTVAPGTAVDADGRTLVLPDDPAAARTVSLTGFLGRTVNVYLVFDEVEASPQATGTADFGRWLEQPRLQVVDTQGSFDFARPPVLLARVVLNNRGVERVDLTPVQWSGLRLPGPLANDPTLRTAPSGNAVFSGTFTTDGSVGVATPAPTATLHVTGTTRLGGALTVDGASTLTGDVSVATASLSFGETTRQMINLWRQGYGIGVQNSTQYFRSDSHFAWFTGGSHNTAELNPGGGTVVMALRSGNLGLGTAAPAQRLTVASTNNAGKDADSGLSAGGSIAIKSNAPQIDFIDTDHNDWAIHVNSNKMYFIRQPWVFTDLVLDGAGNVGMGTESPSAKLHVTGDTLIGGNLSFGSATRQMLNLWTTEYGLGVQASTTYFRTGNHFAWYQGGAHHDAEGNNGGGTTLMALRSGNLGVGVAAPAQKLVVAATHNAGKDADSGMTYGGQLALKSNAPQIDFIDTDNNDWSIHVNSGQMYFIRQPWEYQTMVLDPNGNIGIGTAGPQARLDVNGWIRASGGAGYHLYNGDGSQWWSIYPEWGDAGDPDLFFDYSGNASNWVSGWLEPMGSGWRNNSDIRMKDEVADLGPVLDRVVQLRPTSYRFLNASEDRPKTLGFIAQEVAELFPDLVVEKRGYLSLNYNEFAVLAIAAVRELAAQVVALQEAVNGLLPAGAERLAVGTVPAGPLDRPSSAPAAAPARKAAVKKAAGTKAAAKKVAVKKAPARKAAGRRTGSGSGAGA